MNEEIAIIWHFVYTLYVIFMMVASFVVVMILFALPFIVLYVFIRGILALIRRYRK